MPTAGNSSSRRSGVTPIRRAHPRPPIVIRTPNPRYPERARSVAEDSMLLTLTMLVIAAAAALGAVLLGVSGLLKEAGVEWPG